MSTPRPPRAVRPPRGAAPLWFALSAVLAPAAVAQDGVPDAPAPRAPAPRVPAPPAPSSPDGYAPVRRAPQPGREPGLPDVPTEAPRFDLPNEEPPRLFDAPGEAYGEAADPRPYDAPTPLPARGGDEQVPGFEETPEFGRAEVPGPPRPGVDALPGTPFFADTEYGARPGPGVPGAPGFGLPHRPEPINRYGVWYAPKLFHAPNRAVYRPSPFRPRGFGNLFDRPCVPDRIDYTAYTVRDLPSRYGPTYYPHFRENTECLIRPTRGYDPGPHAEANTGGCRLGADCYRAAGYGECRGCPPPVQSAAAVRPAAGRRCDCDACRRRR